MTKNLVLGSTTTSSPTFLFFRCRYTIQLGSRCISWHRLYYRKKIFLASTDIMFGSQNLLIGHIFCHCSASKTTNTQHILSILLFSLKVLLQKWSYYSKNMNLVSTHAEERDLEIKTEMNASNYTEFQVLQQVLETWTPPPFGNTITQGTEVFPTHLIHVILRPWRKHLVVMFIIEINRLLKIMEKKTIKYIQLFQLYQTYFDPLLEYTILRDFLIFVRLKSRI